MHGLKLEREKQLALWAGVIFFMAIVVFVWVLNFKQTVSATAQAPASGQSTAELSDLLDNLKTAVNQTKAGIGELQDTLQNNSQQQNDGQTIQELQSRLTEMERRVELEKLLSQLHDQIKQAEEAGQ